MNQEHLKRRKKPKKKKTYSKKMNIIFWVIVGIFLGITILFGYFGYKYYSIFNGSEITMTKYQVDINNQMSASQPQATQARAELVAKDFASDFYTWKYKQSRGEMGGVENLWSNEVFQKDFTTYASETFYAKLNGYANDYGVINLPAVSDIQVVSTKKLKNFCNSYYDKKCFNDAYEVNLNITYDQPSSPLQVQVYNELNMPSNVTLTMVWDDNDYKVIGVK